jgi:hypothetical protein
MIVKLKDGYPDYPDLSPDEQYFVIGIEADDFRILNDFGKPYLYPSHLFEIVDSREPKSWITVYGDDGERYSYPPTLNEPGFFEDYFDGKNEALSQFWKAIPIVLSEGGRPQETQNPWQIVTKFLEDRGVMIPGEANRQLLQQAIGLAGRWTEQHKPARSSQSEAITDFLRESGYQTPKYIDKGDLQEAIYVIMGKKEETEPEPTTPRARPV